MADGFEFPDFFEYPPYFTLQPNPDTRRKQVELWKSLILRWCKHANRHVLRVDSPDHPLFHNPRVSRTLPLAARRLFVDALVEDGAAEWLTDDGRSTRRGGTDASSDKKSRCLVLWQSASRWGEALAEWARAEGHEGRVVTAEECVSEFGPEAFRGADLAIVVRAARALEEAGKAAYIKGEGGDDDGIKFF